MHYVLRIRMIESEGCVFFNDTATTEIYTLSLHDALPISDGVRSRPRLAAAAGNIASWVAAPAVGGWTMQVLGETVDRKSTRLNSSHANISYAVFCLKKKKAAH